jgi:hypothetical protein
MDEILTIKLFDRKKKKKEKQSNLLYVILQTWERERIWESDLEYSFLSPFAWFPYGLDQFGTSSATFSILQDNFKCTYTS